MKPDANDIDYDIFPETVISILIVHASLKKKHL